MLSQAQIRQSPYLVAFMLAAMMVWALSAITRSMDGALQQTHVQLRAPIADLGTAIQDSAIALKHRLKPQTVTVQPGQSPSISRPQPSVLNPPLIQEAFTPVTAPQVIALTELIVSSTPGKGKAKGYSWKGRKTHSSASAAIPADVLKRSTPLTDTHPGKGKAHKRAGR